MITQYTPGSKIPSVLTVFSLHGTRQDRKSVCSNSNMPQKKRGSGYTSGKKKRSNAARKAPPPPPNNPSKKRGRKKITRYPDVTRNKNNEEQTPNEEHKSMRNESLYFITTIGFLQARTETLQARTETPTAPHPRSGTPRKA